MDVQISIWDLPELRKRPTWKERLIAYAEYQERMEEHLNTMCRRCINYEVCEGSGCAPKKELRHLIYSMRLVKEHNG